MLSDTGNSLIWDIPEVQSIAQEREVIVLAYSKLERPKYEVVEEMIRKIDLLKERARNLGVDWSVIVNGNPQAVKRI